MSWLAPENPPPTRLLAFSSLFLSTRASVSATCSLRRRSAASASAAVSLRCSSEASASLAASRAFRLAVSAYEGGVGGRHGGRGGGWVGGWGWGSERAGAAAGLHKHVGGSCRCQTAAGVKRAAFKHCSFAAPEQGNKGRTSDTASFSSVRDSSCSSTSIASASSWSAAPVAGGRGVEQSEIVAQ